MSISAVSKTTPVSNSNTPAQSSSQTKSTSGGTFGGGITVSDGWKTLGAGVQLANNGVQLAGRGAQLVNTYVAIPAAKAGALVGTFVLGLFARDMSLFTSTCKNVFGSK